MKVSLVRKLLKNSGQVVEVKLLLRLVSNGLGRGTLVAGELGADPAAVEAELPEVAVDGAEDFGEALAELFVTAEVVVGAGAVVLSPKSCLR